MHPWSFCYVFSGYIVCILLANLKADESINNRMKVFNVSMRTITYWKTMLNCSLSFARYRPDLQIVYCDVCGQNSLCHVVQHQSHTWTCYYLLRSWIWFIHFLNLNGMIAPWLLESTICSCISLQLVLVFFAMDRIYRS